MLTITLVVKVKVHTDVLYLYTCKRGREGVNPVVDCPPSGIVHVDVERGAVDVWFWEYLPAAAPTDIQIEIQSL